MINKNLFETSPVNTNIKPTYKVELDSLDWTAFPIVDGWLAFEAQQTIEFEVSIEPPTKAYSTLEPPKTFMCEINPGSNELNLWIKPSQLPCWVNIW